MKNKTNYSDITHKKNPTIQKPQIKINFNKSQKGIAKRAKKSFLHSILKLFTTTESERETISLYETFCFLSQEKEELQGKNHN